MEKIVVKNRGKLSGTVSISAAKNAVLPIIAATILSDSPCFLNSCPALDDVYVINEVLRSIGADINFDEKSNVLKLDTTSINSYEPREDLVRKMRASFFILGPMLAKYKRVRLSLPGGCNIGTRPIDLHLKGFELLGAKVSMGYGDVEVSAEELRGAKIYLDFPSVGATENILMAASLAKGETIIKNAAAEPEIEDLANFINAMGGKIEGAGTNSIKITGVDSLKGVEYTPIYDRIEAGTFMIAAAMTKSKITIDGVIESHLTPLIAKLRECGVKIDVRGNIMEIDGNYDLKPVDIKTMPYPGFPTDMQSQMMALLSTIKGTSIVTETIFENRFMHVPELTRMGASIKVNDKSAIIEGVDKLEGTTVSATDLRAGAALVLTGLIAKGTTVIENIYHIDRGYVNFENKLRGLGADVYREEFNEETKIG